MAADPRLATTTTVAVRSARRPLVRPPAAVAASVAAVRQPGGGCPTCWGQGRLYDPVAGLGLLPVCCPACHPRG